MLWVGSRRRLACLERAGRMFEGTALSFAAALPPPRLALVHDYLLVLRGAERTFAAMADAWPEAPIVTLLYDEAAPRGASPAAPCTTSPLQRLGARPARLPRAAAASADHAAGST